MNRSERDFLGTREVPADAYWGINTLRAAENFRITAQTVAGNTHLIDGFAQVKLAACRANHDLGLLDRRRSAAIEEACHDILRGELHGEFIVDVIQGGAGTSTNMNANEVIANRALEILGERRGDYVVVSPNDHVNLSQSTNDVYPTAARIALIRYVEVVVASLESLIASLSAKADEFATVLKIGRTQLQDAVPMTLGREFAAFATSLTKEIASLRACGKQLCDINLGGTAIGTGLNAPPRYAETVLAHLRTITGLDLTRPADLVEATQDVGAYVQLSGALKRLAIKVSKICNDLRLLSSGPRSGLSEITLPPVQAGSSIMPGKVNPVIPEVVTQVAYRVIGNDVTVSMAAEAGQLQLNAFQPVMVHVLGESAASLAHAFDVLTERCIAGIATDPERLRANTYNSIGLATALGPEIGYASATAVAEAARRGGRSVAEVVMELGLLTDARLRELLDPVRLAGDWRHPSAVGTSLVNIAASAADH